MEQRLDDGEFWLPPEFLTDDDLFADFKTDFGFVKEEKSPNFSYGIGNFFGGFNSDLSSPSTETDSDEDELITGLAQKIASSTLQDSTAKGCKLSGSPQSTLLMCGPGSSRDSPTSNSQVSSPPDGKDLNGRDLLYAAAEEVARIRMIEGYSNKLFAPPTKTSQPNNPNPATGFYPTRIQTQTHLPYHQLQAAQFQHMKQQQMMKSGFYGQRKNPGLSTAVWPTLQQSQQFQQRTGSGMRAVFLGEPGPRKERTGTGVFLPRRVGANPTDTRKKPGCPVLLPERVVHTLNLNLDSIDSSSHTRQNGKFTVDYDAALKYRNNVTTTQDSRTNIRSQAVMNQEIRLPQEWTY